MSITILEVLENAKYNLEHPKIPLQKELGISQLSNAIELLSKGKSAFDDFREEELEATKPST